MRPTWLQWQPTNANMTTALTPVGIAPAIVENSKEGVSTHVVNHAGESNAEPQGNEQKKGDWV